MRDSRRRLVLRLTRHNLHPLSVLRMPIIHLEVHILDDERPDFVAEAVGVEMSLQINHAINKDPTQTLHSSTPPARGQV